MLPNEEFVVRAALIPKMVESGVISPAKAVADFHKHVDEDGNAVYTLSVGEEQKLQSWEMKHDFGCRVAAVTNRAMEARTAAEPHKFVRTFYRGCYRMHVEEIHGIASDIFQIEVHRRPTVDLPEHCDIELRRTGSDATKGTISAARTRILAQLRLMLRDPQEHICKCDLDCIEMLEPIKLILSH
ncbi:hypothetical protein ABIA25_001626 [Sinorhizobium fredii]|uniref:hypothetical protein n=1 Tax=Rhizobium fredii TaxID=380 RepID=UPI003518B9BC